MPRNGRMPMNKRKGEKANEWNFHINPPLPLALFVLMRRKNVDGMFPNLEFAEKNFLLR
jgi:hypothetical protein